MSAGPLFATSIWVLIGDAAATTVSGAEYLPYQISKLKENGDKLEPRQEPQSREPSSLKDFDACAQEAKLAD